MSEPEPALSSSDSALGLSRDGSYEAELTVAAIDGGIQGGA
jgi:hypothetical protein